MDTRSASTSNLIIHFPPKLWLRQLSRDFPSAGIQITAFVPIKHDPFVGNSMINIKSTEIAKILTSLERYPSLISYSVMEKSRDGLIINTQTKDNLLLRSIVRNNVLVKLPVNVSNGTADFYINGSRSNIDQFITDLTEKKIRVDIKSIGHFSDDLFKLRLTSRQNEVYQKARKSGYYDNPRKITLTGLAEQLGTAKSSLSSMLQRIHKVLLG